MPQPPVFRSRSIRLPVVFTIAFILVLFACDSRTSNDESGSEIVSLQISPDSVALDVGESQSFSVVGKTEDGETVSDVRVRWWSTNSSVFDVDSDGLATAQDSGRAHCMVELIEETPTSKRFVGRDSAFVRVFLR